MTYKEQRARNERIISDYLAIAGTNAKRRDRGAAVNLLSTQYDLHPTRIRQILSLGPKRAKHQKKRAVVRKARVTTTTKATPAVTSWLDKLEAALRKELEAVRTLRAGAKAGRLA